MAESISSYSGCADTQRLTERSASSITAHSRPPSFWCTFGHPQARRCTRSERGRQFGPRSDVPLQRGSQAVRIGSVRAGRLAGVVAFSGAIVALASVLLIAVAVLAFRSMYSTWEDHQTARCQAEGYDVFVLRPGEQQCLDRP